MLNVTRCLLLLLTFSAVASAQDEPKEAPKSVAASLQDEFAAIAQKVFPSVVTVTSYVRDASARGPAPEQGEDEEARGAAWVKAATSSDYPGYRKVAVGSGFVLDKNGEILTNRHILMTPEGKLADLIDVETQDQRNTICSVIGMEPTLNIALIKLEVFNPQFPPQFAPIELGDSGKASAGHWAIAMGEPFGPEQFFRPGVISSLPNRDCYQEQLTATYLQVALQAHPQAYGGPVVDIHGRVIGILTPEHPTLGREPRTRSVGIEFAMPMNVVLNLLRAIRAKGSTLSPWLGYAVMSRAELRKERGAEAFNAMPKPRFGIFIENVFDPSPAHAAGIQPGDFLVKFDGKLVHTPLDFQRFLYLAGIGARVKLEMWRNGEAVVHDLLIEQRPANAITR